MFEIIGAFHRTQNFDAAVSNYVSAERWEHEKRLLLANAFNLITLYGGVEQWKQATEFKYTVCMKGMPTAEDYEEAKSEGVNLIGWLGDEPQNDTDRDNALKRWDTLKDAGVPAMITLNDVTYFETFVNVDYLVLFVQKFNEEHIIRCTCPIVYWSAASIYADWYREHCGLAMNAKGYKGIMPWATLGKSIGGTYDLLKVTPNDKVITTIKFDAFRAGLTDLWTLDYLDEAIIIGKRNQGRGRIDLLRAVQAAEELRERYYDATRGLDVIQNDFRNAADEIYREIDKLFNKSVN